MFCDRGGLSGQACMRPMARASVATVVIGRCDPTGGRPMRAEREAFRRSVIGGALGVDPGELEFERGGDRRPLLSGGRKGALSFTCASTTGLMAVAYGGSAPLGVDVERRRSGWVDGALCAAALSGAERRLVARQELDEAAFFQIWTRKEAVMKAAGVGLRWDPRAIDVAGPEEEDGWIRARTPDGGRWHVRSLGEFDGCCAALACDRPIEVTITMADERRAH